ncbi:MAG: hypothetical protein MdMp014T_1670 [Treponematales bacterium]
MTTNEVMKITGAQSSTVRRWAAANGVAYTGEGRRKTYNYTEADIDRAVPATPQTRPALACENRTEVQFLMQNSAFQSLIFHAKKSNFSCAVTGGDSGKWKVDGGLIREQGLGA